MATAGLLLLLLLALVMSTLAERLVNRCISSFAFPLQYVIEFFRSAIGGRKQSEEGGKERVCED